jgi:transposase
VLPTRTKKPRDKAAVEAGVLTVERWVLAPLRHRQFFSLYDLNAAMAAEVAKVNAKPFRGEQASRKDLFIALERPALRSMPASRYELAEWKKVTASIDYHVEGPDKKFYSVPYGLVRQRLDLRASATTIELFKGGRRVASHVREHGRRRYVTDPAHMPASHRAHAEWTPSKLIAWGRSVSEETGTFVERLLASRPHPEHAYRACLGLRRLARQFGTDRLSAACARALSISSISYSSVKSILAEGLDRLPLDGVQPAPPPPTHENLRGAAYWSEEA